MNAPYFGPSSIQAAEALLDSFLEEVLKDKVGEFTEGMEIAVEEGEQPQFSPEELGKHFRRASDAYIDSKRTELVTILSKVLRENFDDNELSQLQFLFHGRLFWKVMAHLSDVSQLFMHRVQKQVFENKPLGEILREAAEELLNGGAVSVEQNVADC